MEEGKILILEKGEKPINVGDVLKGIKFFYYKSGDYIKITITDKKGIEKLKELGFNELHK